MLNYLYGKFAQKLAEKKLREIDHMLHYTEYHQHTKKIKLF